MTIPEIEETLNKQRAEFEKLAKALSDTVEDIKELRHQLGVQKTPQCGTYNVLSQAPDPFRR